jgi:hypothetical protein
MAGEQKQELRLAIAHVLFIDIVGYSKLLTEEQSEALQKLNELVRGTARPRPPTSLSGYRQAMALLSFSRAQPKLRSNAPCS